jgi:hypothetical protein
MPLEGFHSAQTVDVMHILNSASTGNGFLTARMYNFSNGVNTHKSSQAFSLAVMYLTWIS